MVVPFIACGSGGKHQGNIPPVSDSKTLLSFSIESPQAAGLVDESTRTVSVTVPYGTDVTKLVAVFLTSGSKTLVGDIEQTSGSTSNDFTSPVTYRVVALDGTSAEYAVTVTVAAKSAKELTSFSIAGIPGTFSGMSIALTLPFGTDLTGLAAEFTTTGTSVTVGGKTQVSGETENDFTQAVEYTVSAADGSSAVYTVTVTAAKNQSKEISYFAINGHAGVISDASIGVTLPYGTAVNALVAVFTTTGTAVTVSGTEQVSGETANNFSSPVVYKVTAADGSWQAYTVTVTVAQNTACDITSFSIGGVAGSISGTSIGLTLPFGTDRSKLVAEFSTTGAKVAVDGVVQVSRSTQNDFTGTVRYDVTAADGVTVKTYSVTVSLSANSAKSITAFSIDGYSADIVNTAITLTLPYSYAGKLSSLIAVFTAPGATVKVGGVTQTSGVSSNDFRSAVVYRVTAADGTFQDYTVTVSAAKNSAKDILTYSISGVSGTISGTSITLTLPFGTPLSDLVAAFTTTGESVWIGSSRQTSGVTANRFSGPVTYTVAAADGSTKDYTVTVSVALNGAKDITAFSVGGQNGIISGTSIGVLLRNGTALAGLAPSFTTTGVQVTVGGDVQTSGSTTVDFSSSGVTPVEYVVKAADGTVKTYYVTVAAAALGKFHPSSGAYAPVSESSWGSASWERGASFSSGEGSTLEVGVFSANATKVVLEIYGAAHGENALYDYDMVKGSDSVWRAAVALVPGKSFYAFRAWGPNWTYDAAWTRGNSSAGFAADCDSNGNRFNPNKVLYDPYAKELSHDRSNTAALGSENGGIYGTGGLADATPHGYSGPCTNGVEIDRRNVDTGRVAPKSVTFSDSGSFGTKPAIEQKNSIIYEAHVRGLTKHSSSAKLADILSVSNGFSGFGDVISVPDAYRGTYKGAGCMAGYLKDLGINTIELLPVQETDNDATPSDSAGGNFWGYMTYGYFAPDRRYAFDQTPGGPTAEFKEMVKAFHDAGIEVYMDVVYNHTGEGGNWDGTKNAAELTSFRGLDNSTYYCLVDSDKWSYWETTGCGNNFRCDNAAVRQLILDSLTYWIDSMGVDGFRFDLAPVLGREQNGSDWVFNTSAATITQIRDLGAAKNAEMIAEAWDCSWPGGYQVSNFTAESSSGAKDGWGEWNGIFRDVVRKFVKGDGFKSTNYPALHIVMNGSYGLNDRRPAHNDHDHTGFFDQGGPQKSVNFITAHDGFTLMDLVSYNAKSNGGSWPFGVSDGGSSDNDSWDCGGDQALRRQQLRNFWTILFFSRGVPMTVYGDEFGRTQNGNNNAYNLDSVATWNNYGMINTDSPDAVELSDGFTGSYHDNFGTDANADAKNGLFSFVKKLIAVRKNNASTLQVDTYDISYSTTNESGSSYPANDAKCVRTLIDGTDTKFLLFMNAYYTDVEGWTIPSPGPGKKWVRIIDTGSWAESSSAAPSHPYNKTKGADNIWDASSSDAWSWYSDSGDYTGFGVSARSIVVLQMVSR